MSTGHAPRPGLRVSGKHRDIPPVPSPPVSLRITAEDTIVSGPLASTRGPIRLGIIGTGLAVKKLHWPALLVFILASLAIIPMAAYIGEATEALAHYTGPRIGGLLNATLGNAAELIITIVAIRAGLLELVKASITGSINSVGTNLLFVFRGARNDPNVTNPRPLTLGDASAADGVKGGAARPINAESPARSTVLVK